MKGLLQIHDPLKPKGHAVGIDLGTTNSLVASVINGKPRCLAADEGGALLLPSVVHYGTDGGVVVGSRAQTLLPQFPTDTIKSVKRFMGKSLSDPETKKLGSYKFSEGTGVVSTEHRWALALTSLRCVRHRTDACCGSLASSLQR